MKKTNPRKIPRTQEDVDRAYTRGIEDGVSCSSAIFLTVMCDKYDFGDKIAELWGEINKLSEEVREHRVSLPDLRRVLEDEYGVRV